MGLLDFFGEICQAQLQHQLELQFSFIQSHTHHPLPETVVELQL